MVDGSVFHDEDGVLQQADVLQRVAVHGDDVGEVSGRDTADPVVPADQLGCMNRRTARRTSSTESATPTRNSCGTTASTSGASPVMSPPPPEQVTYAPATRMRGPATQPSPIASRSATSTKARNVPTSRTVVKPASRVSRAVRAPESASWAPVRASSSAYPWPLSGSPTR